jgi:chitinase
MRLKFEHIIVARRLGGAMAWSLGEDSYDWSHMIALRDGVASLGGR